MTLTFVSQDCLDAVAEDVCQTIQGEVECDAGQVKDRFFCCEFIVFREAGAGMAVRIG